MSEPLKYKAEKTIAEFIAADLGWPCHTGQNPGPQSPPCVVVYANGPSEAFANAMPKNVRLAIEVVSGFDRDANGNAIAGEDDDRQSGYELHRQAVAKVEARLQDLEALQAFANCGTARPVRGFHVYDIQEDSQQSTMSGEDRMLISQFGYTLVCQGADGETQAAA